MIKECSIAIVLLCFGAVACSQVGASSELVLRSGAHLRAHTSSSNITVIAGNGFERRYEWDRCSLNANMSARSERWLGSLGIYDPAGRLILNPFAGCHGISRTVVQEGQIHFADEAGANAWISKYRPIYRSVAWTNDGLLVAWDIRPERSQLNVDVYQICIHGQRPVHLNGAMDDAVQIPISQRSACARVADSVVVEPQKAWSDLWSPSARGTLH
jgi:hypothetical protein